MDALRLGNGEMSEPIMFLSLSLDVILVTTLSINVLIVISTELSQPTPIGFAAVLIASERSLNVRDILANSQRQ